MQKKLIKVAILDLYNGEVNQGMRCIKDIISNVSSGLEHTKLDYDVFEIRLKEDVPDYSKYEIFISSGGPGSPFDGEGMKWDNEYFKLMGKIWSFNQNNERKKHLFFICHSFQMMARFFKFADVTRRRRKSFGIHPVHKTEAGQKESIFMGLPDPFYAADFREWQVVQPNKTMTELNASILALEKERPHVDLERAIMAVRVSDEIIGTQFHPEADPESMYYHFKQPERQEFVFKNYGEAKYYEMLDKLKDPGSIPLTHDTILPGFLKNAAAKLEPELIES